MTQRWKNKIILAAVEATYGVDPAPAAANGILAVDVALSPMEGTERDRNLDTPYLGGTGMLPAELHQRLTFKVELVGSGTAGTVPGWGVLMRGCACAETIVADTSVTYNPISDNHESLTFYVWIDGTQYVLGGSRGTCTIGWTAQNIPYLEFTFTALYRRPAEVARIPPDLSAFQKPRLASAANTPTMTIAGNAFVTRSFSLDLANQVEPRFLINQEEIIIVERADVLTSTVAAVPLTTFDPYAAGETSAEVPVVMTHDNRDGYRVALNAPTCEMQRTASLENAQNIVEWPLRLMPLPSAGNDQWTLVLT